MPSYKKHYPDRWLSPDHLKDENGNPRPVTLTIKSVTEEEAFNPTSKQNETRWAASFPGREIMMLLNKTQCEALAEISGSEDTDDWRSLRVTLTAVRAPNGKRTIKIVAAPPKQTPVHGRAEEAPVHGQPVHGQPQPAPVHGRAQEPLVHGDPDPKSDEFNLRPGAEDEDGLFFSVSNLIDNMKTLHATSTGPMSEKQFDFIVGQLRNFGNKDGQQLLSGLVGRECTVENPAGEAAGRYLWELLREDTPKPNERRALRDYCDTFKPKRK